MKILELNNRKTAILSNQEVMRLRVTNILRIKIQKLESNSGTLDDINAAKLEMETVLTHYANILGLPGAK
jgi:hypothetical protein